MIRSRILFSCLVIPVLFSCNRMRYTEVLLRDDFSQLDTGLFSAPVGPHTEYHYLPEAGKRGNWEVTSFASGTGWGIAWQVKNDGTGNAMYQTMFNKSNRSTHPMIISGDSLWKDYKLTVKFSPEDDSQYSGIAFRYKNDRCFYFLPDDHSGIRILQLLKFRFYGCQSVTYGFNFFPGSQNFN